VTLARALAGDETAAQPWPPQSGEPAPPAPRRAGPVPVPPPVAETSAAGHAEIRAALAASILDQVPGLAEVAAELALGAHPWPDLPVTTGFQQAVVAQLNPWLNERHPDVREMIADRLRRLVEVFRDHDLPESIWTALEAAALRLADAASTPMPIADVDIPIPLTDLIGGSVSPEPAVVATMPADETSFALDVGCVAAILGAVARTGSTDLGTILGSSPVETSLAAVLRAAGLPGALAPFDNWIGSRDHRSREIILKRTFALTAPSTLQELADEQGITRERVRQIENQIRKEADALFASRLRDLADVFEPLRELVLPMERFELVCTALGAGFTYPTAVAGAVAVAAGPWSHQQGWTCHSTFLLRLSDARKQVRAAADEYGLLPADASSHLDGLFATRADHEAYVHTVMGLAELNNGYWSLRDTVRVRVIAALRALGRPATKEEIIESAGLADQDHNIGGTLSNLEGVVRADKTRWAFTEWVDEPYDGIVNKIDQRIDENHGSVAVATLMYELPRRYGVSEKSISVFISGPAYMVEDGFVRKADRNSFVAQPPNRWPDAVRIGDLWGQKVRVEGRHLAGYSFRVRFDIAYANGVRPNDDLLVPLDDGTEPASVIWRAHDPLRTIDVGRVADLLTARGFMEGDEAVICASRERVVISKWSDQLLEKHDEDVPPPGSGEYEDPLARLLGGL